MFLFKEWRVLERPFLITTKHETGQYYATVIVPKHAYVTAVLHGSLRLTTLFSVCIMPLISDWVGNVQMREDGVAISIRSLRRDILRNPPILDTTPHPSDPSNAV